MKKEQFDALPPQEKEHYKFCAKCNEYYDLRDAQQVRKHVHGVTSDSIPESLVEIKESSTLV